MLYIISTPIGNLMDLSLRSIEALKSVDYIYAEDTRKASKILDFISSECSIKVLNDHNEYAANNEIISYLKEQKDIALISDAGSPLISDPGYPLVRKCIEEDLNFTVLPGPSSVISALILSGLPVDSFVFYGFIPRKKTLRKELSKRIKDGGVTTILFESPKRIKQSLSDLCAYLGGETNIAICREMTKPYENIFRGTLAEAHQNIEDGRIILKGEFVVVLNCSNNTFISRHISLNRNFCEPFLNYLPVKQSAKLISTLLNLPKPEVYDFLIKIAK